jgi:hypothetical protein
MSMNAKEDAQAHMTRLAIRLLGMFGPLDAAGLLAGAAVTLLRNALGDERAADYFATLADEIDSDKPGRLN